MYRVSAHKFIGVESLDAFPGVKVIKKFLFHDNLLKITR